jgi:hypothetical protein
VPLPLADNATQGLPFLGVIEDASQQQGAGAERVVALRSLPFQSFAMMLPQGYSTSPTDVIL